MGIKKCFFDTVLALEKQHVGISAVHLLEVYPILMSRYPAESVRIGFMSFF
jgi:hypothetical protein